MIEGEKILITGPTGQVAYAIAVEVAKKNDVYALARFGKPGSRDRLERHGMHCIAGDFVSDDLGSLIDDDYDRVLHFAVYQQAGKADFEYAIEVNAVGTGKLMYHTRKTKSFLYCSTCSVYKPRGRLPRAEDDPLGEGLPVSPTYGPSKLAGEAVVKFPLAAVRCPRHDWEAERGLRQRGRAARVAPRHVARGEANSPLGRRPEPVQPAA